MRHRLEEHVRNPIPVAVLELAAGQRKRVRALVLDPHLGLAQRAEERHPIGEPDLVHQTLQPRPLDPLTDDPQPEVHASQMHERRRAQQHVIPLLLHQPPHAQHHRRPLPASLAARPRRHLDAVIGKRKWRGRPGHAAG